jgi:hypothetical protein
MLFYSNLSISLSELFLFRTRLPRQPACRPGILKIKATSDSVDIQNFARKIESRLEATLHGLEVNFG